MLVLLNLKNSNLKNYSFLIKKKLVLRGRQKMPKCPPFRHYEQQKHVKKFWEASVQTMACGGDDLFFLIFTCFWGEKCTSVDVMTFFLGFICFWAENWTSADIMTLKELVLHVRSENMVTLVLLRNFSCYHSK